MNTSNHVVQPQMTYIHEKEAKSIHYGARVTKIFVYNRILLGPFTIEITLSRISSFTLPLRKQVIKDKLPK